MFDQLTDRLQETFRQWTGRGALTEKNIDDSMRQVRVALLEADVNYGIVKEFVDEVRQECLGEKVLKSVSPGQQAIKVVHDSLIRLMGEAEAPLNVTARPTVILMVGLHGGGKTTTTAKLAFELKRQGKKIMMVAVDLYRPAAIDQLETLGREIGVTVYADRTTTDAVAIATASLAAAREHGADVILMDTAGRLQIDEALIGELITIKSRVQPAEVLLVADAALGQEAVSVAKHFDDAVNLTGIVLTKLDGDARGGAALSMRKVTGKPIKFVGVGEKIEDLEPFRPERIASRILGMGDVVSLVERAAETISEEEARKLEQKMLKNKYDFDDFLSQLRQLSKLGGLANIMEMIPGGRKLMEGVDINPQVVKHTEAVLCSMTRYERANPELLNQPSRRQRIARGSGRPLVEVQQLLKRFDLMRGMLSNYGKMSRAFGGGGHGGVPMAAPAFGGGSAYRPLSQKEKKAKRKKHKQKRHKR